MYLLLLLLLCLCFNLLNIVPSLWTCATRKENLFIYLFIYLFVYHLWHFSSFATNSLQTLTSAQHSLKGITYVETLAFILYMSIMYQLIYKCIIIVIHVVMEKRKSFITQPVNSTFL